MFLHGAIKGNYSDVALDCACDDIRSFGRMSDTNEDTKEMYDGAESYVLLTIEIWINA